MATVFKVYTYKSDDNTTVNIKGKAADFDAIGNVAVTGAAKGLTITRGKLRKIDGVCTTTNPPTRRRIVCCDPANPRFTAATPATFGIPGIGTFTVVGRIGEKRY